MRILSVALVLGAGSVFAGVRVGEVEYLGWKNAVEIDNGDIRVVVVPQIGRIMHYGFVGGENILWSDSQHHGKVLPGGKPNLDEEGQFAWTNFGGDKVWPKQQSEFARITGHSWPPDHAFDGGVDEAELLNDGVRITSPVSSYNGARSVREIRVLASGSRVEINQRIEKFTSAADASLDPLRYTIWNVTQIRPPEQTFYPLNPHSHFDLRYHPFDFAAAAAMRNFTINQGRYWHLCPRSGGGAENRG